MAQAPGLTLDAVDLTDPDAFLDGIPHDWFALLRDQAPVHWTPELAGRGFWSITRYADVVSASKDWRTYSSEIGGTSLQDLTPEQVEARKSMLDMDPPAHTRLRAIVNKGFTPKIINTYEERIRDLSRRVLADAFARDELDFVHEVSMEIPMRVFAELLGAPAEDRRLLIAIGDRMLGNTDPEQVRDDPVYGREDVSEYAHLPFSSPAALDMFAYGHRLAEQRRAEPRDDIVTKLIEAEVEGSRLTEREFDVMFLLLTVAGNETTRHSLSVGLHTLLERPDLVERLLADPSLCDTAADEILRWATPVLHFRRTASRDTELHGVQIAEGDKVLLWYAGANFDERQFPDPLTFDVSRAPNKHVTFGLGGPHFCLGAHLAKLEVKVVLEELLPYLDRLELAGPPDRLRSNFFCGVKRLPVRLAPRR
jgi:cytochrome P450